MSEVALFAVGFVLFVVTSTATLLFGYLQFHRIYRADQARSDGPDIVMEGNTEVFVTPNRGPAAPTDTTLHRSSSTTAAPAAAPD